MADMGRTLDRNKYVWWYALCFFLLGWIDQRRGSATGDLQMLMSNLTGPVLAGMLFPSIKKEFVRTRYVLVWTVVSAVGIPAGILLGKHIWAYAGQWNTAVINVAVAGYLVLYVIWNRQEIRARNRMNKIWLFMVMGMLLLMQLSVNEAVWPIWFLVYFGCFYCIGIPDELEPMFIRGMLVGIIAWFFVQQSIAFGFRPYDYVRYRGLYSGETQNGLFYMIVFCAFTGMWLYLREKKAKWPLKLLCFLLSAGSVAFLLLTGGRSSLLGAVAGAVVAYMLYDIFMVKSFKHWVLQGLVLGLCILALLPVAYGCVRYLPTVLHHPIWFEGEYNESYSVRSFDPWDSERYVTFEQVLNINLGRILDMFGIEAHFDFENENENEVSVETPLSLTARAAAPGEPGSSEDNPLIMENVKYGTPMGARIIIYCYYGTHLNFRGHTGEQALFYYTENAIPGYHAHDMFLQIAFDYGILPGILFLVWSAVCFVRLVRRKDLSGIICAAFFVAIVVYGLAEMAVVPGQITLVLMFLLYYFAIQEGVARG